MATYDIIMIAVLIGTIGFGFWKGMAWQVASLASLVVSYVIALEFGDKLAPFFKLEPPVNYFAAMFAIYIATSLVIWIAFRLVADIIDRVKLKEFDRQVGALFGAVKGVVLCAAITFFAVTLSAQSRQLVLEAKSGEHIARLIDKADAVMPQQLHAVLGPYLHQLEKGLDHNGDHIHEDEYHGSEGDPPANHHSASIGGE